jgi:lipopolysaccharide export system protein LptA
LRILRRFRRIGVLVFGLFCSVGFPFSGPAEADPVPPPANPVSTVIKADHMLAENIQNEIHFVGHVHLVKRGLTLKADSLDVYFIPPGKGSTLMDNMHTKGKARKIQTMVARGHVYIKKGNRVAYAGKAVYIEASHLFVLTKLPVVIQNGDRISGERITFFTRINKSLVQGHSLMLLHSHRNSSEQGAQTKKGGGGF